MIGSIIGKVAGGIFGGISASKAMKKVKQNIETRKSENDSWYNRRYNEDATQRADAQRLLTMTEQRLRDRNRAAAGAAAVTGATDESVAAEKAANAAALADATAQIAAAADSRKDAIESWWMGRRQELTDRLDNMEIGKVQAISQAVGGIGDAASSIAGAFVKDQAV